jgi:hypothetical protein
MSKVTREYQKMCHTEGVHLLRIEARGGHYALHFERGFIIAASTPSDYRAYHNLLAEIRRLHAKRNLT